MNNNTLQMIELARSIDGERLAAARSSRTAQRAGPSRGVRARLGRGMIAAGERLAYGRTQTATR